MFSGFVLSLFLLLANRTLDKSLSIKQYIILWTEHFLDIVGVFASQGKCGVLDLSQYLIMKI